MCLAEALLRIPDKKTLNDLIEDKIPTGRWRDHIKNDNIGNIYVNRNIVGAVVGSQPFGGNGKSGTGPKAGGPQYLKSLCNEYSISNNITAMGGNANLLSSILD
jgi:delta 1-pyrroline-5-carboxylate dehydrogenase